MGQIWERAAALRAAVADFVLEAEGGLATALESYSAERLMQLSKLQSQHRQPLVLALFPVEGELGDKTPLDCFLDEHPELSESDRHLIQQWKRSFVGLFVVQQVPAPNQFELMNWLTAKSYVVRSDGSQATESVNRLDVGQMMIALIAPVTETEWVFASPLIVLGKLGKPKLAVAIGSFKDQFNRHLYGDAPDLLEDAWQSVQVYHQDFIEFFGGEEVTLPGYQLEKRFQELQARLTQRHLAAAGLDGSKSLEQLAQETDLSEDELDEVADALGSDRTTLAAALKSPSTRMMPTQITVPQELKRAEQVTVLTHPRWGQTFSTQYPRMKQVLEQPDAWDETTLPVVQQFIQHPSTNSQIWYRLAEQYPAALEQALRQALDQPGFTLDEDLGSFLRQQHLPLQPVLPEIASVPIHLHNLFQDALAEVHKTKSKATPKRKAAMGFQR